jgi:hypothetical protein
MRVQTELNVVYDTLPCIWTAGAPVPSLEVLLMCVYNPEGSGSITGQ